MEQESANDKTVSDVENQIKSEHQAVQEENDEEIVFENPANLFINSPINNNDKNARENIIRELKASKSFKKNLAMYRALLYNIKKLTYRDQTVLREIHEQIENFNTQVRGLRQNQNEILTHTKRTSYCSTATFFLVLGFWAIFVGGIWGIISA